MSISPIQGFKAMSPGKKAATVAGTAVAVGATAFVVASAVKGKGNGGLFKNISEGAKIIYNGAKEKLSGIADSIKNKFKKTSQEIEELDENV